MNYFLCIDVTDRPYRRPPEVVLALHHHSAANKFWPQRGTGFHWEEAKTKREKEQTCIKVFRLQPNILSLIDQPKEFYNYDNG